MTAEEIQYYINTRSLSILLGRKLSELDIKDDSLSGSYFLVSTTGTGGKRYSKYISYENLIEQMAEDISALLGLSSMAFRDTWEYSKNVHQHDYNFTACYPTVQISDYTRAGLKPKCVATILTSNSQNSGIVSVLYPIFDMPEPELPEIGEMRLIASTKTKTTSQIATSIQNGTFDGWVYPNGAAYYKTTNKYDFTDAFNLYGGTGNMFNVPDFKDFIKLNGNPTRNTNKTNKVNYQNYDQNHNHSFSNIGASMNGQLVEATITFPASHADADYGSTVNGLHTKYKDEVSQMNAISANIRLTGLQTEETSTRSSDEFGGGVSLDVETKPNHVIVPAMVYIGNKRIGS